MKLRWLLVLFVFGVVAVALWLPRPALAASPAPQLTAAAKCGSAVIVKRGDTLTKIARRCGVSVRALAAANGIQNINRVRVGQRLIIPAAGSAPAATNPAGVASGAKWIEIDLSRQRLIAHQGNSVVLSVAVSTGLPGTPTPVGAYRIRTKVRSQTMTGPGYSLPNVQWVQYFLASYALHGTYWHHNFGRPMSHGCVNLTNRDARFLYNWAPNGTQVIVHR